MKIGGIFIPILRRMTMRLKKDKIEEPTPAIEPTEIIAPAEEPKGCRACVYFEEQESQLYCSKLKTHCTKIDNPNLGTNLWQCKFIPREVKECANS